MATALRPHFPEARYCTHADLDVTVPADVERVIRPGVDLVIHAAAITDHQCPDVGRLIDTNILGTLNVVKAAASVGARVVYLSTHYVYPGVMGNYRETDPVNPIGTYAWTKYAGERIVTETCSSPLIIRGSWYTPEKLAFWAATGALVDAYSNREPIADAAQKIARLIKAGANGIVNIGGSWRTFYDLTTTEYEGRVFPLWRHGLDGRLPYRFPVDSSVNTERYASLVR